MLGCGSIDRRLLRSPVVVVGSRVYRQETPTESPYAVCEIACSLPNAA
jgi:hypothetical protein